MHKTQSHDSNLRVGWGPANAALVIMLTLLFLLFLLVLITLAAQPAQGQNFQVLYSFTGGADGGIPNGLTLDAAGNLYGTTYGGGEGICGSYTCGTVFKLTKRESGWLLTRLYSFRGGEDGEDPTNRVSLGTDGNLFSTTSGGGGNGCDGYGSCGTVFKLAPPARTPPSVFDGGLETVLYRFRGVDGSDPYGDLAFDQLGNVYGTAPLNGGGVGDCGLVYKVKPSGGSAQTALHRFNDGEGCQPYSGVIFDQAGNLYGTTRGGGTEGFGTVFQLTPSGAGWTISALSNFNWDSEGGCGPIAGLIFDSLGNLYGATPFGGSGQGGAVFELSPSGAGWTFTVLYSLAGTEESYGPIDRLAMDRAGNLYGTTYENGAYGYGSVFKLTPTTQGWTYQDLYDFAGGADGYGPSGVTLDANGNLYGAASAGGPYGAGAIFEITP